MLFDADVIGLLEVAKRLLLLRLPRLITTLQSAIACARQLPDLGSKEVPSLLDCRWWNVSSIRPHKLGPCKGLLFTQFLGVNRLFASTRTRQHL